MLILTAVWLAAAVFTCAKRGSDLNYFIPLRIIEAIAAGTLCIAALRSKRRRLGWALADMGRGVGHGAQHGFRRRNGPGRRRTTARRSIRKPAGPSGDNSSTTCGSPRTPTCGC